MSSCSCGSSCKCGSGCNCNNMYPDISETATMATRSIVTGLAPQVNMNSYEGVEMGFTEDEGGCKCGSSCTCGPCNC